MKNILFCFLWLFCALTATAQKTELQDTSYTEVLQGKFYNVKLVTYSDGSYTKSATAQTDTTIIYNEYVAKMEAKGNQIADAAVIAMQARKAVIDFARADTFCLKATGLSPINLLMDTYSKEFESGSWVIKFTGSTVNVTFPVLSTNKRKRLLPQGGTAKTLRMAGRSAWITNYPFDGINLLYQVKPGFWSSIDGSVVLMRN